jgi:hypothetical protein
VPPQDPSSSSREAAEPRVSSDSGPAGQVASTIELVKAYARQETVDHFKGIGRFVGYGIVGATCVALGIVLLVVGLLRLLQDVGEDTFYGFWSIVPYLLALIVCAAVVALALSRIQATDVHRRGRKR